MTSILERESRHPDENDLSKKDTSAKDDLNHFLVVGSTEEVLNAWIKNIPNSRLPPFTRAELNILQRSWLSFVSTTMTPGALALSTLKEFYSCRPEMLEMKIDMNPAAIQELATIFGAMLNSVVKNLDNQKSIVQYILAYDVERQRDDTPSNILYINEFYKVFRDKFLRAREDQNDHPNLWSIFFDTLFRLANWQYLHFYYVLFDETIKISPDVIEKGLVWWSDAVETHSLDLIAIRVKGHLHLIYPEVESLMHSKGVPNNLFELVHFYVEAFNVFVDDCIRRIESPLEEEQQREDEEKEEEEEEEEKEKKKEDEEEVKEKDPIFTESAFEEFLWELAKKREQVPIATALDFISLLSHSMLHSLRIQETSASQWSPSKEALFVKFFSFWIRCCERLHDNIFDAEERKRRRERKARRKASQKGQRKAGQNRNAVNRNAADDDSKSDSNKSDKEPKNDGLTGGMAALTPQETIHVGFVWRRVICGGSNNSGSKDAYGEVVAGNMFFAQVLQKVPDMAQKLVGDARPVSAILILSDHRVQDHIRTLMNLMSNIVSNLHLQESLPTRVQELVDFFSKWNYNAIAIDAFLKACFKVFCPFMPNNTPQRLASRFYESWRKFLSLIGKWYKSLAEVETPLASLLRDEEPETAYMMKYDYDVAKEEAITTSDYTREEAKVLFSSWKMLEGITRDGISYKIGAGCDGGSHQILGAVIFMYLFRGDPELRYQLFPHLNYMSDMDILRSRDLKLFALRVADSISAEIDAVAAVTTGRRTDIAPVRVGGIRHRLLASIPAKMTAPDVEDAIMESAFDMVNRGLSVKGVEDERIRTAWRKFLGLDLRESASFET